MYEIIATNLADVINISKTNATNIELCQHIDKDGLSPDIKLVSKALRVTTKNIRVMVRIEDSFIINNDSELQKMLGYIKAIKKINDTRYLDGFVFGYLKDNNIDYNTMNTLIRACKPYNITFHKASDLVEINPIELSNMGIDTILTQGGLKAVEINIAKLIELNKSDVKILVGGGVNEKNIKLLHDNHLNIHIGGLARFDYSYQKPININKVNNLLCQKGINV